MEVLEASGAFTCHHATTRFDMFSSEAALIAIVTYISYSHSDLSYMIGYQYKGKYLSGRV